MKKIGKTYYPGQSTEAMDQSSTVLRTPKRRRGRPRKKIRGRGRHLAPASVLSTSRAVKRGRRPLRAGNQPTESKSETALDTVTDKVWKDQELYKKHDMIHNLLPDFNQLLRQMADASRKHCSSSLRQADAYSWTDGPAPVRRPLGTSGIEPRESEKKFMNSATEFCRRLEVYRGIYRMLSSKKIELALRRKRFSKKKCLVTVKVGKEKSSLLLNENTARVQGKDKTDSHAAPKIQVNSSSELDVDSKHHDSTGDPKFHPEKENDNGGETNNENPKGFDGNVNDEDENGEDEENEEDEEEEDDDYYNDEEEEGNDDDDDETVFADEVGPTLGRRAGISLRVRGTRRP